MRERDTLWEIAKAVAVEGGPAPAVRLIADLNDLPGSVIRPGARLRPPGEPAP